MPQPSPLKISTSSLQRLLKEETSYRSELEEQERRLKGLKEQKGADEEGMEGNRVWMVRQEVCLLEEGGIRLEGTGLTRRTDASARRDKSGVWTAEGEDCGCGGEG